MDDSLRIWVLAAARSQEFAVADLEDEPIGEICPRTISLRENHPEDRQRQNLKLLRILKVFAKHLDSNKPSRRFYSPGLLPFG